MNSGRIIWHNRKMGVLPCRSSRRKDTTLSDDAKLVVTCSCGQKMKVPAEARGKKYKCVRCGEVLQVAQDAPMAEAQAPQPAQPEGTAPSPAQSAAKLPPKPAGPPRKERIGEMLINEGIVTGAQVAEALDLQQREGGKTFENLIKLGHLDKDALHGFLSRQPGIAAINLGNYSVDEAIVKLVPKELALRELVLPIDRLGKLLTVAMACPLDTGTVQEIEQLTGLRVKAMLCRLDDIHKAVEALYRDEHGAGMKSISLDDLPGLSKSETGDEGAPTTYLSQALIERFQQLADKGSAREMVEAAQSEPAVSETLLTAVNQGAFGDVNVESVGMAIALIGVESVPKVLSKALAEQ